MKAKNNQSRRIVLDWGQIQLEYDSGLSQRDLAKKYNVSPVILQSAVKRGDLIMRANQQAIKLAVTQGKYIQTHTDETKEKIRTVALQRHADGWDNKAGRCLKYKYTSPIAGDVTLDGTWELAMAQYLDSLGVKWVRNKERFAYTNLSGVVAHYTPDFYVHEWESYIEVKGYETALDRCKWSQFAKSLIVYRKDEIVKIKQMASSEIELTRVK